MTNQSPAEALRQQMRNELLDYAHGQLISGTPIDQHLDSIMELVTAYAATVEREALERIRGEPGEIIPYSHKQDNFGNGLRFMYDRIDARLAALQGPQDDDARPQV